MSKELSDLLVKHLLGEDGGGQKSNRRGPQRSGGLPHLNTQRKRKLTVKERDSRWPNIKIHERSWELRGLADGTGMAGVYMTFDYMTLGNLEAIAQDEALISDVVRQLVWEGLVNRGM